MQTNRAYFFRIVRNIFTLLRAEKNSIRLCPSMKWLALQLLSLAVAAVTITRHVMDSSFIHSYQSLWSESPHCFLPVVQFEPRGAAAYKHRVYCRPMEQRARVSLLQRRHRHHECVCRCSRSRDGSVSTEQHADGCSWLALSCSTQCRVHVGAFFLFSVLFFIV